MTADVLRSGSVVARTRLPLVLRLALREFRGGIHGFAVFIACIALGVAVISGVGMLGDALRTSFERQGETLLGGDVTLARPHKRAEANELAWLKAQGRVSEVATVRAMARRNDLSDQVLVEVKGIDTAYPLVGQARLSGGQSLTDVVMRDGKVVVEPIILERLNLKIGDAITLGKLSLVVGAVIEAEPDKISDRLTVGPRVLVSSKVLEGSGLIDTGSLVGWRYAIKLSDEAQRTTAGLVKFRERVRDGLPEGGFTIRDRRDPSPQVTRTLERVRQFLTLLGLTALLVGGVGVANAVSTYVDRRRPVIATMKSLGATGAVIFGVHLTQVLLIASIGIVIGLCIGLLVPMLVAPLIGSALPIRGEMSIRPLTLAIAAAYGLLVALVFTLWPLGRAEMVRASALFREEVAPEFVIPSKKVIAATIGAAGLLFALAVLGAEAKRLAAYYCLAVIAVLAVFLALGTLVSWGARRMPRSRRPELALAIGSIGAPGGLARSVVLSLGTGLSLLVALSLTDRSIVAELEGRVPNQSPNYFVLDVRKDEVDTLKSIAGRENPQAQVFTAPMLRGRMVRVGEIAVEDLKVKPEHQWVLNGDRGLSYSDTVPEGSKVISGAWWPAEYAGEPLVSFEAELARGLGLKIGDGVTVNVLGRNVTARVASLREVKWESLAINFVMVFSPNTLAGAPHNILATVTLPKDASLASEARIAQEIGRALPAATAIRVKDAINQFNLIFGRIMTAIRTAGSITLLAGALVLAGALATAQRRRIKQAVILKTLGATRRRILTAHLVEYGLLALATGLIAVVVGGIAAWATVTKVMRLDFVLSPIAIAEALGLAIVLVGVFGGIGTWRVLSARPVPYLRSE